MITGRNFECESTGELCAHPDCKVGHCVLDTIALPSVENCVSQTVQRLTSQKKYRLPEYVRIDRECNKIIDARFAAHEEKIKPLTPKQRGQLRESLKKNQVIILEAKSNLGITT